MSSLHINFSAILAAIVAFGNQIVPILPPVWANLISALLGVYALYHVGSVVKAARLAGVKGV